MAQGKKRVSACTVNTVVVVLAATFFSQMNPDEMWIAFSTGKSFRFIPIHKIVSSLTPKTCSSLLAFHAFTGCDTVSSFGRREKKQPGKHGKYFLRSVMHSWRRNERLVHDTVGTLCCSDV